MGFDCTRGGRHCPVQFEFCLHSDATEYFPHGVNPMIALLQSFLGGNVSGTGTTPFTVGTATATLPQTTQAGSLLVIVVASTSHAHTTGGYEGPTVTITVPGISSWTSPAGNLRQEATFTTGGASSAYYAVNAPS